MGRRLCVLISNAAEVDDESTDVSRSTVTTEDIDRSHGIDKKLDDSSWSRNVVVKFLIYKAKVYFMKGRTHLRDQKSFFFINEQLSPLAES